MEMTKEQKKEFKAEQARLKEVFRKEQEKVWRGYADRVDTHMVDYCVKGAAVLVEMDDGSIYEVGRKAIEKSFCFGYSDIGQGASREEAYASMENMKTNIEAFIRENMAQCDNSAWNPYRRMEMTAGDYLKRKKYPSHPEANLVDLRTRTYNDEYPEDNLEPLSEGEFARILIAEEIARQEFRKRVDSYLKRYGLSKIRTWTYWIDE